MDSPSIADESWAEHTVPLTDKALDILNEAKELYPNSELLFPNEKRRALSDNAMRLALQKRLGLNTTVHGLRSSFKDWASEKTNYQNEVSEMALAHSISNAVEAAYRRAIYMRRDVSLCVTGLIIFMEGENGHTTCSRTTIMELPSISPSFLRLKHIIGDGNTPPIIPISKSSWWDGVKKGNTPSLSR